MKLVFTTAAVTLPDLLFAVGVDSQHTYKSTLERGRGTARSETLHVRQIVKATCLEVIALHELMPQWSTGGRQAYSA